MLLTIVLLPLISASIVLLFGRFFNRISIIIIALTILVVCIINIFVIFCDLINYNNITKITLISAFANIGFSINYVLQCDYLAIILLFVVLIISFLVHVYSTIYMADDPHFNRFIGYLSFFTFFMLLLITANDLFLLFIGWEGVGLCSYLLISFWFTRTQANISALKAFFINRIGDSFFLVGLVLLICLCKNINNQLIFELNDILTGFTIKFAAYCFPLSVFFTFCLTVGAFSKSAQLFLHTWLPDAMEGPTPVSALIHAATMVAAGIFLLSRLSFLIISNIGLSQFIIFIGAVTVIFAATSGFFQNDIKKIIAYSTCSQLGYMAVAAGVGLFTVSIFHLTTHAFFKALLFLISGSIIHSLYDIQDIRRYGSLILVLPLTYILLVIGSISLIGLPFTSGFYSKDIIIEFFFNLIENGFIKFVIFLLIFGVLFTTLYSIKLIYITFFLVPKLNLSQYLAIHESPLVMLAVLCFLAFFGLTIGGLVQNYFLFFSFEFWTNSVALQAVSLFVQSHYLFYYNKHIVFIITCLAIYAIQFFLNSNFNEYFDNLQTFGSDSLILKFNYFFSKKWYFDNIYNYFVSYNVLTFGYYVLLKDFENGFFESSLPYLLSISFTKISNIISNFYTANFWHYLYYLIYGTLIIIFSVLNIYFLFKILIIITIFINLINLFFMEIFSNQNKQLISIFHKRRQLMVQRRIWRFFYLFIYYFTFFFATIYGYFLLVYSAANYFKYGEILPNWLIY